MLVSKEQKKAGSWGPWYSATCQPCLRHHRQTLLGTNWEYSQSCFCDFLMLIFNKQDNNNKIKWFFWFFSLTIPFLLIGFVLHVQSGSLLTGSRPWQWYSSGSPSKTVLSCSLDGVGLLRSRVYMDMTKPGVQYPHCVPCAAAMRSCTAVRTMLHALLQCASVQQ